MSHVDPLFIMYMCVSRENIVYHVHVCVVNNTVDCLLVGVDCFFFFVYNLSPWQPCEQDVG